MLSIIHVWIHFLFFHVSVFIFALDCVVDVLMLWNTIPRNQKWTMKDITYWPFQAMNTQMFQNIFCTLKTLKPLVLSMFSCCFSFMYVFDFGCLHFQLFMLSSFECYHLWTTLQFRFLNYSFWCTKTRSKPWPTNHCTIRAGCKWNFQVPLTSCWKKNSFSKPPPDAHMHERRDLLQGNERRQLCF